MGSECNQPCFVPPSCCRPVSSDDDVTLTRVLEDAVCGLVPFPLPTYRVPCKLISSLQQETALRRTDVQRTVAAHATKRRTLCSILQRVV